MFAEISQLLLFKSFIKLIFWNQRISIIVFQNFQTSSHLISKSLARTSVLISVLILSCFLLLMQLFIVSDFSVLLVATHSNALLPVQYKIAQHGALMKVHFTLGINVSLLEYISNIISHTKDDLFMFVRPL